MSVHIRLPVHHFYAYVRMVFQLDEHYAIGIAGIYRGSVPDEVKVEFVNVDGSTFAAQMERNMWVDIVEYIVNEME